MPRRRRTPPRSAGDDDLADPLDHPAARQRSRSPAWWRTSRRTTGPTSTSPRSSPPSRSPPATSSPRPPTTAADDSGRRAADRHRRAGPGRRPRSRPAGHASRSDVAGRRRCRSPVTPASTGSACTRSAPRRRARPGRRRPGAHLHPAGAPSRRAPTDGAGVRRTPPARARPPRRRRQPQRPRPLGEPDPARRPARPARRLRAPRPGDRSCHLAARPGGARRPRRTSAAGNPPLSLGPAQASAGDEEPTGTTARSGDDPGSSPSPSPAPAPGHRRTQRGPAGARRTTCSRRCWRPPAPTPCSPSGTPTPTSSRWPAADPTCCAGPTSSPAAAWRRTSSTGTPGGGAAAGLLRPRAARPASRRSTLMLLSDHGELEQPGALAAARPARSWCSATSGPSTAGPRPTAPAHRAGAAPADPGRGRARGDQGRRSPPARSWSACPPRWNPGHRLARGRLLRRAAGALGPAGARPARGDHAVRRASCPTARAQRAAGGPRLQRRRHPHASPTPATVLGHLLANENEVDRPAHRGRAAGLVVQRQAGARASPPTRCSPSTPPPAPDGPRRR